MIRDPSDGSVRKKSSVDELPLKSASALENESNTNGLIVSTTSGLPDTPTKSDELIRLEKSREWLKLYSLKSGFSPSTM